MGNRSPLAAVVLSAGCSTRMQRFKPLLAMGRQRVVERVVALYQTVGIDDLIVVVGHRAADLRPVLAPLDVRCVENPDYRAGMFASVKAGVRELPSACGGVFVHPVDIPLVRPGTVDRLAAAFAAQPVSVAYPVFAGRRGHPPLIDAGLVPRLLQWSGEGGLRSFLENHDAASLDLTVADEAVGMDLDTPADYRRMLARLDGEGVPTANECRVLMEEIQALPAKIQAHCRMVAMVAREIAVALKTAGVQIDIDLVHAAALLHDIARLEPDHAQAGARLLARHGFSRIAPIVGAHMALDGDADGPLDAVRVVYLADKLVGGDRLVGVTQRLARAMDKHGRDPAAVGTIKRRMAAARRIQKRVEDVTGRSLDDLLAGIPGKKACRS